jgi:NADH:ubiquinone reductase (H+-translocating)
VTSPTRVLVAGGGYIGLYTCLVLEKALGARAEITLVAPQSYMTYQPFLPEAASGNIEPRHVVIPLRRTLRGTRVVTGRLAALDHPRRTARVVLQEAEQEIPYDHVVIGIGSVSRVLPVPGLGDSAIGFRTVEEAIFLRNRVLSALDGAEASTDARTRASALTFCFVGGGYSGIEALAELEDLARDAARSYRNVTRDDMRWVLVEASGGILPEIGQGLGTRALERLRKRGIEVHLDTRLESAEKGHLKLSDGTAFDAGTLVWTTGVRAHPLAEALGFETDDRGRIVTDEHLRVSGQDGAWSAGDCAAVPDLTTGGTCPPTAQHALRQARRMAKNIAADINGKPTKAFRYKNRGGLVSLGRYKGVARVMGVPLSGFAAWFLHRTYHVLMIPTLNRKVRVLADWTVALFFKRDAVQLGSLANPREPFIESMTQVSPPEDRT